MFYEQFKFKCQTTNLQGTVAVMGDGPLKAAGLDVKRSPHNVNIGWR